MHDKTRKMLHAIDRFLALGGEPARELSTVLSALRGPDHKKGEIGHGVKSMTTVPIRIAALPLTAEAVHSGKLNISMSMTVKHESDEGKVDLRATGGQKQRRWNRKYDHFNTHVVAAARILGLQVVD